MIKMNFKLDYFGFVILGTVILLLLRNQKTRRMTLKILLGIVLTAGVSAGIGAAEFFLFGEDLFAVIYPFTLLDLLLIIMVVMAFRTLSTVLHLRKTGERTTGTVIELIGGRGSGYKARYQVNGQEYICIGNRLTDKGKCGEEMTICYRKEKPEEAILEGENLISAVIQAVAMSLLMGGWIVTQVVVLSQI